ncbi:hypothetical protein, partial [Kitasatospora putterlickiae]
MAVGDEARLLAERGRRLLEEHAAAADPRQAALALSGALTAFSTVRALLEQAGPDGPAGALAEARFLVGVTLCERYWQAVGQPGFAEDDGIRAAVLAERAEAVELLTLTMAVIDQEAPEREEAALRLGLLLHARHEHVATLGVADPAARPDDLDRAIDALRIACPVPLPPGPWRAVAGEDADEDAPAGYDAQHPGALAHLGCALADRAERDAAERDRAAAEAVLQGLLDRLYPAAWNRPAPDAEPGPADLADTAELMARERLARLLLEEHTERAVDHLELVAATSAADSPFRLSASLHLVELYWTRGDGDAARPEDAAHRLARLRDLRRLLPPDHPYGGTARWWLGNVLVRLADRDRYAATDEGREAADVLRESLGGMAEDHPVRPASHAVLGSLINALHQHEPGRYRTEEAVHHLTRAVETMEEEDHGVLRREVLNQLADVSIARDVFSTDRDGLERVIGLLDAARARPSGGPRLEGDLHGSMAAVMSKRFALTNAVGDLDEAIHHQRAAFRRAAPDDLNRMVYLANLSVSLYQRYLFGGDHQDLEASRRYTEEVLAFLPDSAHAGMEGLLKSHRQMYERNRLMLEFQEALATHHHERIGGLLAEFQVLVAAMAQDDPLRLMAIGDLGAVMFIHAAQADGEVERLMEAVHLMTDAAERTPAGHLHKAMLTLRAASALTLIAAGPPFSEHRAAAALARLDEFLADADPASLEGTRARLLRAGLLSARYQHAGRPDDVAEALAAAEAVREQLRHGPPTQLLATVNWLIASAHRARLGPGDRRAARESGLATLRQTAAAALLQAG